jgi:2-(1,2-epoxy-1,2-dihydrophenyl)acetyl-CoA isomerase
MAEAAHNASAQPLVLEESSGSVSTLRMNRPDRLNALNVPLGLALAAALQRAAADHSVRAVVLTGAGRAFCAGGDLTALRGARDRNAPHELKELLAAGRQIVLTIAAMPKPVIAAVNGAAAGGGMNLSLACDVRIASDQAVFAESFANIGLYPDFGGTYYLPRLVGEARAAELFFTGEIISASQAEKIGIVSHVVPAADFEEETRRLAGRLAAAPPLPVRNVKQALRGRHLSELERVLDEENRFQVECFLSQDAGEGFEAFFAKRKPSFLGR